MWSFVLSWWNKLTRIWSYLPTKDRFPEGLCHSFCGCHRYNSNKSIMGGCKSGVLLEPDIFISGILVNWSTINFIGLIKSHASGYCNGVAVWSRIYGHHIWRVPCFQQKWSRTSDGREFMGHSKHWGKAWVYFPLHYVDYWMFDSESSWICNWKVCQSSKAYFLHLLLTLQCSLWQLASSESSFEFILLFCWSSC